MIRTRTWARIRARVEERMGPLTGFERSRSVNAILGSRTLAGGNALTGLQTSRRAENHDSRGQDGRKTPPLSEAEISRSQKSLPWRAL